MCGLSQLHEPAFVEGKPLEAPSKNVLVSIYMSTYPLLTLLLYLFLLEHQKRRGIPRFFAILACECTGVTGALTSKSGPTPLVCSDDLHRCSRRSLRFFDILTSKSGSLIRF